ncbi:MAG: hypothetical protein QNK37_30520 [Acidobacteriota bacterium]|nr:hypothetical protein [Acidobacteriota bacterium]
MTAIQGNESASRALEQSLSAAGAVPGNSAERVQEQPQEQSRRPETDTVEISSRGQGNGPEQAQGTQQTRSTEESQPLETTDAAKTEDRTERGTGPRLEPVAETESEVPGRRLDQFA